MAVVVGLVHGIDTAEQWNLLLGAILAIDGHGQRLARRQVADASNTDRFGAVQSQGFAGGAVLERQG